MWKERPCLWIMSALPRMTGPINSRLGPYLPQPDIVTNLNTLAIVDSLTDSAVTYPFLSNMFNTAEVKVYNTTGTTSNLLVDTGVWDSCDFHDRKLLVFTNNSQVCVWLAPYRTNITTVQAFSAGAPKLDGSPIQLRRRIGHHQFDGKCHSQAPGSLSIPIGDLLSHHRNDWVQRTFAKCSTYEVAGIALDYGRVTPAMLQPYEDFYWGLQRQRATNNSFVPPVQDYQGTAAYLLAMGYYQKNDAFDALNQQWHGVRGLINFESGLGAVGNSAQTNMQARVDMATCGRNPDSQWQPPARQRRARF